MALCSPLTLLASALAPVTTMPPPMPSRNISSRMWRNPVERGNRKSATAMQPRPRMSPALSPWVSSSGPTPSEAMMRPSACTKAMVPFCVGVRWNRSESSGRMVPSIAAIIP